ncbi:cell cycle checkpoint control protein RAD9A isoform X2 [Macaca nemestrina]|uniref:cell cycle checkpoint control protein RAD9A isoform X2 n=1 Tax=Macaca nemestrina TaxID=9545 RepID=UPI0039B99551
MGKEGFSRWWQSGRTIEQVCEQKQPEGWVCGCPLTTSLSLLFVAQLSLRTVNSSRSAYACFLFAPLFFQQYQAATPGQDLLRCKILMKSFLSVFRSLAMLEKTVEKCCISLNGRSSRLVVQLHCKFGVRKTHNLSFQDCESLQAVFDPASCPHMLRAPARVLGEAVLPFPPALAEVTLGIGRGRRVILRSYHEEEADSTAKAMVTEMCLGEEDFQQLQAQEGVAITFCLKEFRGLLSFAESANLNLSIHFDAPGRPAIFTIKDSLLDGHFVLATLSDTDSHSQDLGSPERHQPVPQLQAHRPQSLPLQCSQLPALQTQPSWSAVLRLLPPREASPRPCRLPSLAEASPLSLLPGQGGKGLLGGRSCLGWGKQVARRAGGLGRMAQCTFSTGSWGWPPAQPVPGLLCSPAPVPWEGGGLGPMWPSSQGLLFLSPS